MSIETNKAIVRRLIEQVWNDSRVDLIEEFYTEDVVDHIVGISSKPGQDGVRESANVILNAFPDLHLAIDDEIAEGDKVVIRWTMTGSQKGELLGIPATSKQVTQSGMTVYRLVNARVAELWFLTDKLRMMQQLGVTTIPDEVLPAALNSDSTLIDQEV